ncbi:MAG: GCN5-related N-acetyltransferase [Actinomycetia bacterium]|nr:GCN5-related N-acetyltransferase [Actinomycetes bacterium]
MAAPSGPEQGTRLWRVKEPNLREIDVPAFRKRIGALLDVYTAAMDPPLDQLPGRHAIMQRHAVYPGFRAIVAERRRSTIRLLGGPPTETAGFIYGFHGAQGQWWHDVVYQALVDLGGRRHAEDWLADPFEVAELHVHPDAQGQGLGRRLITELCEGRPERTVVLSTLDRPGSRARRLYQSLGLTDLLSDFEFPGGGPPYAVMGAALPLARYASAPSRP